MTVFSYLNEPCLHYTICKKCGVKLEWTATFSSTVEENREYILQKFKWLLLPSFCPDCQNIKEEKEA